MESYPISWWRKTADMSPFVDNVSSPIYENIVTGEKCSSQDLPIGACYAIERGPGEWPPMGADGLSIACVCPSVGDKGERYKSHWYIDNRASNCTMPNDKVHRCWVRHGTVGDQLHVDKGGNTCAAGQGSIQMQGWHGYLQRGVLHT